MSEPLASYSFQHCALRRWSQTHMDSWFPEAQASCPAEFRYEQVDRARAKSLGYTDGDEGVTQMHLEHDASHHLIAQARGLRYSPTLYAVAMNMKDGSPFFAGWHREESEVKAFQKYTNDGIITDELRGLDQTCNLKALCSKLKEVVGQLQLPQSNEVCNRGSEDTL